MKIPFYALINKTVVKIVGYKIRGKDIKFRGHLVEAPKLPFEFDEKQFTEVPKDQNTMEILYGKRKRSGNSSKK